MEGSAFQKDCRRYYAAIRSLHSQMFCFDMKRVQEEMHGHRYQCSQAEGVKNIFSFIKLLEQQLAFLNPVQGLDLGCGSHYFTDYLYREKGWDVIGLDADGQAIALARRQYARSAGRYLCHDVLDKGIPFADQALDFILCNSVIQHFSRSETAFMLSEAYRSLAVGGLLLLIFKKPASETSLTMREVRSCKVFGDRRTRFEDKAIKAWLERSSNNNLDAWLENIPYIRLYTTTEILSLALKAGFHPGDPLDEICYEYVSGKGYLCGAVFLRR